MDTEPLYIAKEGKRLNDFHYLAIPSGVRLEHVGVRLHYSDGSVEIGAASFLDVPVLLYDPEAYSSIEYYLSQEEFTGGMDATGPYSWKFSRKLPVVRKTTDELEGSHITDEEHSVQSGGLAEESGHAQRYSFTSRPRELVWIEALIDRWEETYIV